MLLLIFIIFVSEIRILCPNSGKSGNLLQYDELAIQKIPVSVLCSNFQTYIILPIWGPKFDLMGPNRDGYTTGITIRTDWAAD